MNIEQLTLKDTPRFTFSGINTRAKVLKIYDPDTFTIGFIFNSNPVKINIRLNGIDAPELKSDIPSEKQACILGRDALKELLQDKIVIVKLHDFDKYGRALADVYLEGIHINNYLCEYNYVRAYSGGTKLEWTQEELDKVGKK